MAGSSNQFVYGMGATLVNVGTGTTAVAIIPAAHTIGMWLKYVSGGSLSIVNGTGVVGASGYLLGTTDYTIPGPAQFFLNATGSTAVASIAFMYSSGWSNLP